MALILTTYSIGGGGWIDESERGESIAGWDSLQRRIVARDTDEGDMCARVSLGDAHPDHAYMICVGRGARKQKGDVFEGTFSYKGIIDTEKPYDPQIRNWTEIQSTPLGTYPGQTIAVPLESPQSLLGLTIRYVATTLPDTTESGTNITPALSLTPPDNIWDWIAEPKHVYPYGWVLDSREVEIIPGTTICLVTDQFVYRQNLKMN